LSCFIPLKSSGLKSSGTHLSGQEVSGANTNPRQCATANALSVAWTDCRSLKTGSCVNVSVCRELLRGVVESAFFTYKYLVALAQTKPTPETSVAAPGRTTEVYEDVVSREKPPSK
jgi:hypothetical protein